jgi:hypothetical protein
MDFTSNAYPKNPDAATHRCCRVNQHAAYLARIAKHSVLLFFAPRCICYAQITLSD